MRHLLLLVLVAACKTDPKPSDDTDVDTDPAPDPGCYTLSDGSCVEETFANPPGLTADEDGVHRLRLDATEVDLAGERHCVRAYNGGFVGPTIETPARQGTTPRSVRVDLVNALADHDYQSLEGGTCTCTWTDGTECVPEHVHDKCVSPDDFDLCTCRDEDGEPCEHMFDFNVTNLHAHGSHVRPDYARGGEACESEVVDLIPVQCRECGSDTCDDDLTDDTCFHGDNVLNAVHPATGARYRWDIDEDGTHHTGLQWYHPHIHGTTAMQVASGAAGAWIIRGELDALPGIADARERVMLFSTPPLGDDGFQPLPDGQACDEDHLTFNDFPTLGAFTAEQMNLINGQHIPRLVTPPDQVERWRILHAGFLDEVFLGLFRGTDHDCTGFSTADDDTLQLTQIGRDGLILPQTFTSSYVFMSPGYRVEAMLGGAGNLADGETWCLVAARFLDGANPTFGEFGSQPMAPQTPPTPSDIFTRFGSDGRVVAILNVTSSAGAPTETELPDPAAIAALAPSLELDGVSIDDRCADAAAETDSTAVDQAAMLQVGFWTVDDPDPCGCDPYNVNCGNFESVDRSVYPFDRDLVLDEVDHWRVAASLDGHPFHIHINPFVVCPNDNVFDPLPFPHWRDTYLVNFTRKIDLITQNRAFTGPYVFHCHKLTHEDHGMMEVVRVCDPATDPTCGDYHWRSCAEGDLECAQALAATDCALGADGPVDLAACVLELGSPLGVCGPNACGEGVPCDDGLECIDHVCLDTCDEDADCAVTDACSPAGVCLPAPCFPPCGPGDTCVHGTCE